MSLDSTLRSRLVASGDSIVVNVEQGLREVHGAVARRRSRITAGTAAALALVLAATDSGVPELRRPGPPPAREVEERLDPPEVRRHDGGVRLRAMSPMRLDTRMRKAAASDAVTPPAAPAPARPRGLAGATRAEAGGVVPSPDVRSFVENYERTKVGVITTGENGGLACSDGKGHLGGNDCFMFEVLAHETRLEIRLLDDGGVPVPAHVFQYPPGSSEAQDLGKLCGGTVSPLVVTPGATIAVYISSSDGCSGPITTGEMTVRLWGE